MLITDDIDIDDAADTLRFRPISDVEAPTDPDATSIYDLRAAPPTRHAATHRRLIRSVRRDLAGLRDAVAAGWDVGPELAHEERRLAALEAR
jgi:hypothetical protein